MITARHLNEKRQADLLETIAQALSGGVDAVQLRERDLATDLLYELALKIRALTKGRALFFVNDRLDIALAVRADGVHLGEHSLPSTAVISLIPPGFLLSRAVHSVEGARLAALAGVNLIQAGTIFATSSHPGEPPAGPQLLQAITAELDSLNLPERPGLIAIGGLNANNAAIAMGMGAQGIAVISALNDVGEPSQAARNLKQIIRSSKQRENS